MPTTFVRVLESLQSILNIAVETATKVMDWRERERERERETHHSRHCRRACMLTYRQFEVKVCVYQLLHGLVEGVVLSEGHCGVIGNGQSHAGQTSFPNWFRQVVFHAQPG